MAHQPPVVEWFISNVSASCTERSRAPVSLWVRRVSIDFAGETELPIYIYTHMGKGDEVEKIHQLLLEN
jgi:hypothetical protein